MTNKKQTQKSRKAKSVLSDEQKLTLYKNLVRADHFDKCYVRRIQAGQLISFYHAGEGGLAPGVGACSFLRKDDILWPHHRAHGQGHMLSKGIDLKYYLAEHTGKTTGCCQGRSSYHWCFPEYGVYGTSGCIGAGFSPTVGWGLACKKNGRGQVTVMCCGDGGTNRGTAHESMLMASNWKLPIVYLVENNGLAIFSRHEDMHPTEDIADMAKGYGMPGVVVDGQDVIACAEAVLEAVEHARAGKGPYLVEAKTARYQAHGVGLPDLVDYTPRTKEDIDALKEQDSIKICCERLIAEGVLTQDLIDQIEADAVKEVEDAERFADESPIADQLDLSEIDKLIYAD